MLGNDRVQFGHCRVSSHRVGFTKLIDSVCIELSLLLHLLSQTSDVLLFALQLLILLLNHLLQSLDSLVGCIRDLFLLFLRDGESLKSVVLDGILENDVLRQILITLLPHSQTTNLRASLI